MSDKKQGEAEQPSNNIVWIIALSIILNVALGSFIYSILREVLGFNDDYASLTSIAICIFLAYKYFKHNEKDKATDKNTESKQQESHRGFTYREIHDIPEKENNNKHKNTVFNENELNQKELDRYISKNHSKEEIGLFYERYVGYVFEKKGWHVIYHGAKKGKQDEGIDLICMKKDRVRLVQCKYWSQNKSLFENSIFQLYGTWQLRVKNNEFGFKKIDAYIITSTTLGAIARNSAETLDVKFTENFNLDKNYPKIKCTTTKNGEKIYHLPTDQQYDNIGINKDSRRFYVRTVADAVAKGHRRAYRHAFHNHDL
ncbi:restriction endonuclease [Psychrobacter sp. JCM 18900]|uniref:restriction endonuclease n=1 Tax=Psychrobacter sp. JCM 18900 TaxID=1298608 RepID=UPI0019189476|nr:restriction endonuclease [Psychrobacter sp. JCM 18900]